jgi:predicted RNase H-like HicB family nuclease
MKKTQKLTISEYELSVVIEEEKNGGYIANCSTWSDCYAEGETVEEVVCEISQIAKDLIKLYQEKNIEIPLKLKKEHMNKKMAFEFKFPLLVPAY